MTSSVEEKKVPYVFAVAYPDYKRPWVSINTGVIALDGYKNFFLEQIANKVIFDSINNINSPEDIQIYLNKGYFIDSFMDNPPFQIDLFIDNKWTYYHPSCDEIYEYLLHNEYWCKFYNMKLEEPKKTEDSEELEDSEEIEDSNEYKELEDKQS
jgi:hypothetical protein